MERLVICLAPWGMSSESDSLQPTCSRIGERLFSRAQLTMPISLRAMTYKTLSRNCGTGDYAHFTKNDK